MESHPEATVIPTVLFTDRRKWRKHKDVSRQLETEFNGKIYLHFEYVFIKLFEFNARDYYHYDNPLIKILLPKMNYEPHERAEVIRQALLGLYKLVTPMLFSKYSDFIDIYAEIQDEERESIRQEIDKHKEETAMLMQYLKEEGFKQGRIEGKIEGELEGKLKGLYESLTVLFEVKFGSNALALLQERVRNITDTGKLRTLIEAAVKAASPQDVLKFIEDVK